MALHNSQYSHGHILSFSYTADRKPSGYTFQNIFFGKSNVHSSIYNVPGSKAKFTSYLRISKVNNYLAVNTRLTTFLLALGVFAS